MARQMSHIQVFARIGAAERLKELKSEMAAIHSAFPGIEKADIPLASVKAPKADGAGPKKARKRSGWSAAARKAVGLRMKEYWKARKKAEAA